ncbi:hypothetical protein HKX48_008290 [Thoreauomyces humboldtii]|nr:hypothetical protein HKX48_008290 [Thoreauomyces humboldtii]
MSCCGAAKWKREQIEDHKFDLIDVDDFTDKSLISNLRYGWVFVNALKSVLVYMADLGVVLVLIYTAIQIGEPCISSSTFSSTANTAGADVCGVAASAWVPITGRARFALTLATISLSYILLALEWKKGLQIVKSKDISYAFTNTVAYRYYVLRSYGHFCLFSTIESTRKVIDEVAFWVFFTFRGWKRLLLAELPRQFLNFLLLADAYRKIMDTPSSSGDNTFCAKDQITGQFVPDTTQTPNALNQYPCKYQTSVDLVPTFVWLMFKQPSKTAAIGVWLASITVAMWALSAFLLVCAFIVYIPLLFNIRGNLKEYCCHKVDKRIDEVLKKRAKKRADQARKREQQEIAKYGKVQGPAPTLPDVGDMKSLSDNPYHPGSASTLGGGSQSEHLLPYQQYYAPSSSNGGSVYEGEGSAYGGHQPPMANPYVKNLAAQGFRSGSPAPARDDRDADMESEYGGSQHSAIGANPYRGYAGSPMPPRQPYAQYEQRSEYGDARSEYGGGPYGARETASPVPSTSSRGYGASGPGGAAGGYRY